MTVHRPRRRRHGAPGAEGKRPGGRGFRFRAGIFPASEAGNGGRPGAAIVAAAGGGGRGAAAQPDRRPAGLAGAVRLAARPGRGDGALRALRAGPGPGAAGRTRRRGRRALGEAEGVSGGGPVSPGSRLSWVPSLGACARSCQGPGTKLRRPTALARRLAGLCSRFPRGGQPAQGGEAGGAFVAAGVAYLCPKDGFSSSPVPCRTSKQRCRRTLPLMGSPGRRLRMTPSCRVVCSGFHLFPAG